MADFQEMSEVSSKPEKMWFNGWVWNLGSHSLTKLLHATSFRRLWAKQGKVHDIKIPEGKKKRFDFGMQMRPDVENSLQIKFVFNREHFFYFFFFIYLLLTHAHSLLQLRLLIQLLFNSLSWNTLLTFEKNEAVGWHSWWKRDERGLFWHPGEGDVARSYLGDGGLLLHSYIDQALQTLQKLNKCIWQYMSIAERAEEHFMFTGSWNLLLTKEWKSSIAGNLLHLNQIRKTKDSPDSARCRHSSEGEKLVLSAQVKVFSTPRVQCQSRRDAADRVNWSVMQYAHFSGRPTGCAKGTLRTAMPFAKIATTFRSHSVSLWGFVQNVFSTYWK